METSWFAKRTAAGSCGLPERQSCFGLYECDVAVRTAMRDRPRHGAHQPLALPRVEPLARIQKSDDPAHALIPLSLAGAG